MYYHVSHCATGGIIAGGGVTVSQEPFPAILLQSVAMGWDVPGHAGGTHLSMIILDSIFVWSS